jgi:CheY-like chemotaxis protein/anti-sigma regulatory factor (Ser/Thr protein kinase)
LVRLVDDLLDVARITRDKISLHRQPIELASVIDFAVEASRPLIDLRKHQLQLEQATSAIWIHGDLDRLTQVLTNLLNNAAKFTEVGGQICVDVSVEGDSAVIRVRDNGIGIPPSKLESVFQLFTQVNRTLDRAHEGLGIGLTVVKRLIEKHDGTVQAHSGGPGHGSEFVVRLPMIPCPVNERSVRADEINAAQPQQTCRILVVDDNQDSAQSLAMMLEVMGHETEIAYDAFKAIDLASSYNPELILMDIGLPQMNGYDACRRIRNMDCGKSMSIVALTGWGQVEDQRRSMEAGFDRHLVKPVDLDALQKLLTTLKSAQNQLASRHASVADVF